MLVCVCGIYFLLDLHFLKIITVYIRAENCPFKGSLYQDGIWTVRFQSPEDDKEVPVCWFLENIESCPHGPVLLSLSSSFPPLILSILSSVPLSPPAFLLFSPPSPPLSSAPFSSFPFSSSPPLSSPHVKYVTVHMLKMNKYI